MNTKANLDLLAAETTIENAATAKKEVKTNFKARAKNIQKTILANLEIRKVHQPLSRDIVSEINFFSTDAGLATIEQCLIKGIELKAFADIIGNYSEDIKGKDGYLASKAIVKCRKLMQAIAQNNCMKIDPYTRSILRNLIEFKQLRHFELERCLCAAIENKDGLENVKRVRQYHSTGMNTAPTQTCSTKAMLQMFNICDLVKGEKHGMVSFTSEDVTALIVEMFKTFTIEKKRQFKSQSLLTA
ncbi:hypothetical protein ACXHD1_002884 [Acinetobacter baumannii]